MIRSNLRASSPHDRRIRGSFKPSVRRTRTAFTLIELLLVISIIGIMASLVISAFTNAAADTRGVLVRQQQAVVQEAVNSWVANATSGTKETAAQGRFGSVAKAMEEYNKATTGKDRLILISSYLDAGTYQHFLDFTSNADQVRSEAMAQTGRYLQITDWPANSYPRVNLLP